MIEIREAVTKKDIKKFVDFPQKLYKGNPFFVPFLRYEEINNANPQKNPALADCKVKYFLAFKDGALCGRIMGIVHYGDIGRYGIKRVRFSRIDFIDDTEVARALIKAVEDFGRAEGLEYIHGPIGFNDLDRVGMLVEGFDKMATFETQYNYEYYPAAMDRLGFQKDADWIETFYFVPPRIDPRIEKISRMALEKYNLKSVRGTKRQMIKRYGLKLFEMIDKSYHGLYGTVPLNPKVIKGIIGMFKLIADPKLICVVVDKDDNVVAGGLALPSIAKAVQKSKGRLTLLAVIRLLWAIKRYKVIDLALIGVLPEYQNKGLNAIVITDIVNGGIQRKVIGAESNYVLEDNYKSISQLSFMDKVQHKRRRAYVKPIEP